MEAFIEAGRVSVNGTRAHLGQRVQAQDRIELEGRPVRTARQAVPRVLLYHKSAGEIVSAADPEGRPTVFDRLPPLKGARWVVVGRLDYNSSGLLILTTSGELAARLMHPRYEIEREYAVRVEGELSAGEIERLTRGVLLEDGPARFDSLDDAGGRGHNHWYRVALKEGRNREVRRLFEAVGHRVSRLIRVRYGPFALPPGLKSGQFKEIAPEAVEAVLSEHGN
jgi:23S rRNA pseudouridine2605 synthase